MNWKKIDQDDDGDEHQRQHHAQAQHRFVHGEVLVVKVERSCLLQRRGTTCR